MRYFSGLWRGLSLCGLTAAVAIWGCGTAVACPFCSATQQTLGEELLSTDVAVLARLIKAPPPYDPNKDNGASYRGLDPDANNATFEIVEKLRGAQSLVATDTVDVPFFGQADKEKLFLITGIRTDRVDWTTPLPLSKDAEGYVRSLLDLPKEGADRLAFFQEYLEHDDPMLAQDSYDEFARAPYDAVIALRDRMHHDRLVAWIHDVEIAPSRRRLYLTMLGVCGSESDVPMLEYYMTPTVAHYQMAADVAVTAGLALTPNLFRPALYDLAERYERLKKQGLDAMIGCYLTLKGPDGLPLVEDLFLKDPTGDFKDIFSAIYALRFHGEETDVIPRERLLLSMRLVLNNPTFADQVIADLSRWEDWGVMDRLASMFNEADKNSYVRQPIATYMIIASEQEGDVGTRANEHLLAMRTVDKDAVEDAERNLSFGIFARAIPRSKNDSDKSETQNPTALIAGDAASESPGDPKTDDTTVADTDGQIVVQDTQGAASEDTAVDEIPVPIAVENPEVQEAVIVEQPEVDTQAAATDAAESQVPASTEAGAVDALAQASDRAQAGRLPGPSQGESESDLVGTPSRVTIAVLALASVILLAGVFAALLRGFGSRTA